MKQRFFIVMVFAICIFAFSGTSQAVPISWTDWTSATVGVLGSAAGTLPGGISVSYTGEITFAQTSGGTNWWTEGIPAPYTGNSVIDNAPPASDIIGLSRSGITNTITFSTPLVDPVMAFVSIGRGYLPVSYFFNAPFTLLSEGQGWWGNGSWTKSGNTLTGREAHGAIQFNGTFSTISWINSPAEYWHGITVGTAKVQAPEPATLLLLGAGLAGLGWARRRR